MKHTILLIIFIFVTLSGSNAFAKEITFPDANEFNYPQYEVDLLNSVLTKINGQNDKDFKNFILNFEYDLKQHKDRAYSIDVIVALQDKLMESCYKIINDKDFLNFIFKYETSPDYDEPTIWKKVVTFVLLRYGNHDNSSDYDEYIKTMLRRREILKKIIENNSEYAPIMSYLLFVMDGDMIGVNPPSEVLEAKVKELQLLIDKFSNSEFAPLAKIEIGMNYFNSRKYTEAIKCYEDVINSYKNCYIGRGDLYTDAYCELVKVYEALKDSEKIKFFFNKINKNMEEYYKFKNFYRIYLE